ncbi:MAG: hypothetical protein Q9179_007916, partial [Wetmoreana sp. 5 TL-2023]
MTPFAATLVDWTVIDAALGQFINPTFHFDSLGVGLTFVAVTAPALPGGVSGTLSDRYGPRTGVDGFDITPKHDTNCGPEYPAYIDR